MLILKQCHASFSFRKSSPFVYTEFIEMKVKDTTSMFNINPLFPRYFIETIRFIWGHNICIYNIKFKLHHALVRKVIFWLSTIDIHATFNNSYWVVRPTETKTFLNLAISINRFRNQLTMHFKSRSFAIVVVVGY